MAFGKYLMTNLEKSEKLDFKIGLVSTHWDSTPVYSITVNDQYIIGDIVTSESGELFYVEFSVTLDEGINTLNLRLENKLRRDTVLDPDTNEIINDMLLSVESVQINDINLGMLIRSESTFTSDDPSDPVISNHVDLGKTGTWTMTFASPFFIWLLENT